MKIFFLINNENEKLIFIIGKMKIDHYFFFSLNKPFWIKMQILAFLLRNSIRTNFTLQINVEKKN